MSIITCPNCQKGTSDKETTCINCGYPIGSNQVALKDKSQNKFKKFIITHKVLSIFIVLVILFCAIGLPIIFSNQLSVEEKMAIKNVQTLKDTLRDPSSLTLNNDIQFLTCKIADSDDPSYTYYFIDYGAKNGFGGIVRDIAVFKDNEYLGNQSEQDNVNVAFAFFDYSRYQIYGLNNSSISEFKVRYIDVGIISQDKVMKNIK